MVVNSPYIALYRATILPGTRLSCTVERIDDMFIDNLATMHSNQVNVYFVVKLKSSFLDSLINIADITL